MTSPKPVHTSPDAPDNHTGEVNGWPPVVRPGSRATTPNTDRPAKSTDTTADTTADRSTDTAPDRSTDTDTDTATVSAPFDVDTVAGFWQARPELATIHQYAQASIVAPWAVLGCVLARVSLSTPPALVLPAMGNGTMGVASLNVFIGLVGPSGSGKGLTTATARGVLDVQPGAGRTITALPLGSGEGISHAFHTTDDNGNTIPAAYSVWFDVAEIDTLTALTGRSGSTTAAEVRKVFSGETLGFQNADPARRKVVDAHTYRAALVAGVQPRKAGPLLADDGGGTPQRFLWMPVMDRTAPDVAPPAPAPLRWSSPVLATQTERVVMDVHPAIMAELEAGQRARLRGQVTDGDGQQSAVRFKVAALLALLACRLEVTESDWQLADYVMSVSDQTRQWMRDAVATDAARAIQARANARAAHDEHYDTAAVARTATKLLAKLGTEPVSASTVLRWFGPSLRGTVEPAIDDLIRRGLVERHDDEYRGQPRTLLRRPE
ncbi:hypothetical protein [Myceligenerans crystallogenes]|uniref:DUF3987 domain-containing protein n=1 Tax=Myceligenerans crystallogenes TaxID=316335 RepID=A0ABP4ZJY6_9MICO